MGGKKRKLSALSKPIESWKELYSIAETIMTSKVMFKDCERFPELWEVIQEVNGLVGLESVKNTLAEMIMSECKPVKDQWHNIIIVGPAGLGKSLVSGLIAKIFATLRHKRSTEITLANQRTMISGWHGQTPELVNNLVTLALSRSGTLLIDEAHHLNDAREGAQPDSYAKSALDTLLELMTQYRDDLVCIFAGYEIEMTQNILEVDPGFERRIFYWFRLTPYTPMELYTIWERAMHKANLELPADCTLTSDYFTPARFPHHAGSVDNFVHHCQIAHLKHNFGQETQSNICTEQMVQAACKAFEDVMKQK